MEENPNVTIEVEALDEEAYKTKFKAYSMEGMPDVVSIWGQPAFLDEVLDAGVLAELNQDDYKDYGFISASLDGFMKDGKLYGPPRNTDVAGFYYNQKMFEDNGWEVPTIYDEFLTLAGEIKDKDIVPLAMDGGDGWPMAVHLSDILFKLTGSDYSDVVSNAISTGDFSDENLKKATELLKESADAGFFQMTSFLESIPVELEEAAVMDGCGIYRIIFQIITPMLKSSIATVAIMTFLNNWNEFMMASTYLSSQKWKTLPFSVLEFTGQYSSNYAVQFAVMALTAAPAVIVYILLNKHITKGAAMGAVKG